MLSLSRKIGESIIINDNVVCTVLEINGRVVKLGFEYPSTASVFRKELHEKIKNENKLASDQIKEVSEAIQTLTKIRASK